MRRTQIRRLQLPVLSEAVREMDAPEQEQKATILINQEPNTLQYENQQACLERASLLV